MAFYNYRIGQIVWEIDNDETYEVYDIDYENEEYVLSNINEYDIIRVSKDTLESGRFM